MSEFLLRGVLFFVHYRLMGSVDIYTLGRELFIFYLFWFRFCFSFYKKQRSGERSFEQLTNHTRKVEFQPTIGVVLTADVFHFAFLKLHSVPFSSIRTLSPPARDRPRSIVFPTTLDCTSRPDLD